MSGDVLPNLDDLPVEARDDLPLELPTEPWTEYNPHTGIRSTYVPLGDGRLLRKDEYLQTEELLAENHDRRTASINARWGNGGVIGSVPLNLLYSDPILSAARKAKDYERIEKWLRDPDNAKWRTRDKF